MFRKPKSLYGLALGAAIILLTIGVVGAFPGGGSDDTKSVTVTQFTGGSGGREFVQYIDGLMDKMPEEARYMSVSQQDIDLWSLEILPYFSYEKVVSFPKIPDYVRFKASVDPMWHNHILGQAFCTEVPTLNLPKYVELNFRTANPRSSWYQDSERFLPTLIHELVHIQGVCGAGEQSETATQVATLETLAALVGHGNRAALYPLLSELRSIGLAALYFDARADGSEEALAEYRAFHAEITGDAWEEARFAKSTRFWSDSYARESRLTYILRAYNHNVWEKLVAGFQTGFAPDLHMPQYYSSDQARVDLDYDGIRDFPIDDLMWFIENAEGLVEEFEDGRR